jgi:hypothetical protein
MAEMTFSCPGCGQHIQCDELWGGHQIQCPACQAEIVVPPAPSSAVNPLVPPVPPSSASRLSAGRTQTARASTGAGMPQRKFQASPQKPKSPAVKYAVVGAGLVAIAAGIVFGLPYYQKWRESREQKASAPANKPARAHRVAAAPEQTGDTNSDGSASAAPAKEAPLVPAVWTLDLGEVSVPKGRVHGSISSADFQPDMTRLARVGRSYVLSLEQSAGGAVERGVLIYLHPARGTFPTNQSWTVSSDERNPAVSQVVKVWKPDPKYAPQQKRFFSGYALKLELGAPGEDGAIPGGIFLALPDQEKSVVAGAFKVAFASAPSSPEMAPPTRVMPTPQADQRFRQRYGIGRPR